jgi:crotonobetainyl-CoA:carnitine CoA-transferase CaiB-like acyl-CoA transferase
MRCADGDIRFALLAPRQWRGMWKLIGEPAEFADPKYDSILNRFAEWDRLTQIIAAYMIDKPKDKLIADAKALRIPLTDLATVSEVLESEHFAARDAFTDLEVAPGEIGRMANGFLVVDGQRAGIRHGAPALGEANREFVDVAAPGLDPGAEFASFGGGAAHPLKGLRILDLGVIVMGAELPRLFADMGADVIKVENRAFPDGMRQTGPGEQITQSMVWGSRNKRSLGIDLRDPRGAGLFRQLAAVADVVMSNFKPGTMQSLGLGAKALQEINPRLVVAESSALGDTGPWSDRMGYGPLVRASTALTSLWRYPEAGGGFCDTNTVYPDHAAARVEAVAILAAVIKARRTGRGAVITASQAETILSQLPEQYLRESLEPGSVGPRGNDAEFDAPFGAVPCAGDDEWCAIEVRGDDDWRALARAIQQPELAADPRFSTAPSRVQHRAQVSAAVTEWTAVRGPRECMEILQRAGVPAAAMARVPELLEDPHLVARGFWRTISQPQIVGALPTENGPARFDAIADPPMRPAPLQGQHTSEVLAEWLGLTQGRIEELIADEVLETVPMAATHS